MAVALAALVVALGGVAFASIPAPNGVFIACYDNSTEAVRVIDSEAACGGSETQFGITSPLALALLRPYGAFRVDRKDVVHTIDAAGIQGVTRLSEGEFCLQPKFAFPETVSPVWACFDPHGVAVAYPKVGAPDCPAGQLEVITGRIIKGKFVAHDESFYTDPSG